MTKQRHEALRYAVMKDGVEIGRYKTQRAAYTRAATVRASVEEVLAEGWAWAKCDGEAHRNPHIDHCGVCMPFWGRYPVRVGTR